MSGTKISELTALTIVAEGDTLAIVDISGSITRKVTVGDLLTTQHPSYVVWNDVVVPLVGRAQPGAGGDGPTLKVFRDDDAGSEGVHQWAWPAGADKWLHFTMEIPHDWLLESELRPHVHWSPSSAGSGNVVWALEYSMAEFETGTFGNTTTLAVTVAATETAFDHLDAHMSAITMTGLTGVSTVLCGRIYRDMGSPDTYPDEVFGLNVGFHYQVDSLGSDEDESK